MNSCEKSNNFKKGCVPTKRVSVPAYFETVVVPASLGPADPKNGEYKNSLVKYEADGRIFLFDGRGIFTELVQRGAELPSDVATEEYVDGLIAALEARVAALEGN